MGWFARTRLSRWITSAFIQIYGLNMDEASEPVESYQSLEALFTRTLKEGARPIHSNPSTMVSPVDGKVAAVGCSQDGQIPLAPGRTLDLSELLGETHDDERDAVVIYLSPKDYHRVHVPREGTITRWAYIPGTLWPVFPAAVRKVRGLFSRNERAVVQIKTDQGTMDVALIGAFGVGRISLACCDLLTNTGGKARKEELNEPMPCARGAHLGTFHLGSTIVLVTPKNHWTWTVKPGEAVQLGQPIGHL